MLVDDNATSKGEELMVTEVEVESEEEKKIEIPLPKVTLAPLMQPRNVRMFTTE